MRKFFIALRAMMATVAALLPLSSVAIDATSNKAAPAVRAPLHSPFNPVDHRLFSDNMNVVAHVSVDGVRVDTLSVAAFVDGECRGVTRATDDGYYMLTIAGNAEETGKRVYFATVIDGETMWMNEHVSWLSDIIYGDLDEPMQLTIASSELDGVRQSQDGITITPTLVRDVVTVIAGSPLQQVSVLAPNGACVARQKCLDNTATLHLEHLPAGVYLVEATTLGGTHTVRRIIKP